jgi:hypothetical protein
MRRLILLACVLLLVVAGVHAKTSKSMKAALKILNLLKQVDGAGSGLDSDTLRGMTPAQLQAGAVVLKDSRGTTIGLLVAPGSGDDTTVSVVRQLNGKSVLFDANTDGLLSPSTGVVYYASGDCSGTPRIVEENARFSTVLLPGAVVVGTTAFYASGPVSVVTWNSAEDSTNPTDCISGGGTPTSHGGCCTSDFNDSVESAAAETFDLSTLGLVPPFHVEGP